MQNKALSLSSGDTLSKKCNAMLGLGIAIYRFAVYSFKITARPPDMQPLGAWTLQIHGFELGPQKMKYADFTWIFSKNLCISKI